MQTNTIDISILSLPLQQELIDFYQFLIEKQAKNKSPTDDSSPQLMLLAGKVSAFKNIDDPVAWQRQQRDEWHREWD